MRITELVAQLRAEQADCRSRSDKFAEAMHQAEAEAELLETTIDRILATDEARAVTTVPATGTDPIFARRRRRDIQALVSEALADGGYDPSRRDEIIVSLSKDLGCRPSKIEAALRAIDIGNGSGG